MLRDFLAVSESDLASYSAIILDVRRMNAHGESSLSCSRGHARASGPSSSCSSRARPSTRPSFERLLQRRPRLLHPGAARFSVDILHTKASEVDYVEAAAVMTL